MAGGKCLDRHALVTALQRRVTATLVASRPGGDNWQAGNILNIKYQIKIKLKLVLLEIKMVNWLSRMKNLHLI